MFVFLLLAGRANAVGEPDYGHPGLPRLSYRDANHRVITAEALRKNETAHFAYHDQEYFRTSRLPVICYFRHYVLR